MLTTIENRGSDDTYAPSDKGPIEHACLHGDRLNVTNLITVMTFNVTESAV